MRVTTLAVLSHAALAALAFAIFPPTGAMAQSAPGVALAAAKPAAKTLPVRRRLKDLETLARTQNDTITSLQSVVTQLSTTVATLSAVPKPFDTTQGTFQVLSISESNVTAVNENLLLGNAYAASTYGVLTLAATVRAALTYTGSNGVAEISLQRNHALGGTIDNACSTRLNVNGSVTVTETLTCNVAAEPGDTYVLNLSVRDFFAITSPDIDLTSTSGNGVWIFQATHPQPVALP